MPLLLKTKIDKLLEIFYQKASLITNTTDASASTLGTSEKQEIEGLSQTNLASSSSFVQPNEDDEQPIESPNLNSPRSSFSDFVPRLFSTAAAEGESSPSTHPTIQTINKYLSVIYSIAAKYRNVSKDYYMYAVTNSFKEFSDFLEELIKNRQTDFDIKITNKMLMMAIFFKLLLECEEKKFRGCELKIEKMLAILDFMKTNSIEETTRNHPNWRKGRNSRIDDACKLIEKAALSQQQDEKTLEEFAEFIYIDDSSLQQKALELASNICAHISDFCKYLTHLGYGEILTEQCKRYFTECIIEFLESPSFLSTPRKDQEEAFKKVFFNKLPLNYIDLLPGSIEIKKQISRLISTVFQFALILKESTDKGVAKEIFGSAMHVSTGVFGNTIHASTSPTPALEPLPATLRRRQRDTSASQSPFWQITNAQARNPLPLADNHLNPGQLSPTRIQPSDGSHFSGYQSDDTRSDTSSSHSCSSSPS